MKEKMGIQSLTCQFSQKGMTLLEVVISMLIVALGLAMSVAMIQTANRFGDTAEYTAFAQQKSRLMIDAMRANVLAKDTYVFDLNDNPVQKNGKTDYEKIYKSLDSLYEINKVAINLKCKNDGACTDAENNAKQDVQMWVDDVRHTLPGGRGLIRKSGNQYEIIVMWNHVPETDRGDELSIQGTQVWFTL